MQRSPRARSPAAAGSQVAKNIVLAGVGSVVLVDDAPVGSHAPGNFLVHADAETDLTVAEASVATLQDMNPLVKVSSLPGAASTFVTPDSLAGFNVLVLVGQPAGVIERADGACAEAGVAFYAAVSRGIFGWVFANLHQHSYAVEVGPPRHAPCASSKAPPLTALNPTACARRPRWRGTTAA